MPHISLAQFVEDKGLTAAARALGVSAPALHKALKNQREILVWAKEDGSYSATETRPFPSQKSAA